MASILGKRPFLDKILGSCSKEQLSTLQSLMNNPGNPTVIYLYGHERLLNISHVGVHYVQLMIDEYSRRYLNGFLVYTNASNCGFFSFANLSSHLVEIEIEPLSLAYVDIYENLTAEEFRRTVADMSGGEGGGGGITVPTFTATTFGVELPDVNIALSSEDCADIIENEYPIITISHSDANETISLTFVRNNSFSGIEKGEPFTNLQYDLIVDDDEDAYLVGLSFSDDDMKSWCMQIGGGNLEYATNAEVDALFASSEE